jgi:5-methylthioadenosine/S-adenosylhomocysteine deaminase
MDADRHVIEDGAIAVRGDMIIAIGPRAMLTTHYAPARQLRAHGKLILPGLINGHTHAPMVLFRGLGDGVPLQEWLEQ